MNIPSFLADEFMKDSWKLQQDFFQQTNTVLTFSTQKKVHVLTGLTFFFQQCQFFQELKAKKFVVQVVQGSIVHTDVDFIVDSANEDLQPISGLAKLLADKAGPEMVKECKAFIATNKKLYTGHSMLTTSGNLNHFSGIELSIVYMYSFG